MAHKITDACVDEALILATGNGFQEIVDLLKKFKEENFKK